MKLDFLRTLFVGINRKDFCRKNDITYSALNVYFCGKHQNDYKPSTELLYKIAKGLNFDFETLVKKVFEFDDKDEFYSEPEIDLNKIVRTIFLDDIELYLMNENIYKTKEAFLQKLRNNGYDIIDLNEV
jgi:transcriptional regulator with XRE-family HTH domain